MAGSEIFSGRKAAPEKSKSNFAQTCNRFSQFLKERKSLGDFAAINRVREVSGPVNTTMSLSPTNMEMGMRMSLDLFPLLGGSSTAEVSTTNIANSRELPIPKEEQEPKNITSSMTMFYGGEVLVFEGLTEDMAREIMSLATQGTISSHAQTQIQCPNHNTTITTYPTQGTVSKEPRPSNLSDLPIARRVSLQRFMEKRKDRIAASAPYQLHNSSMTMTHSYPEKFNLNKSSYEQHEQQQLELKL